MKEKLKELWATKKPLIIGIGVGIPVLIVLIVTIAKKMKKGGKSKRQVL